MNEITFVNFFFFVEAVHLFVKSINKYLYQIYYMSLEGLIDVLHICQIDSIIDPHLTTQLLGSIIRLGSSFKRIFKIRPFVPTPHSQYILFDYISVSCTLFSKGFISTSHLLYIINLRNYVTAPNNGNLEIRIRSVSFVEFPLSPEQYLSEYQSSVVRKYNVIYIFS